MLKKGGKIEAKSLDTLSKNKAAVENEVVQDNNIQEEDNIQNETINIEDKNIATSSDTTINEVVSEPNYVSEVTNNTTSRASVQTVSTDKKSTDSKSKDKSGKVQESESTASSGRIEISSLNIKSDISSSQIKYNSQGNTVIYFEDDSFRNISLDTVIYLRAEDEIKLLIKYTILLILVYLIIVIILQAIVQAY